MSCVGKCVFDITTGMHITIKHCICHDFSIVFDVKMLTQLVSYKNCRNDHDREVLKDMVRTSLRLAFQKSREPDEFFHTKTDYDGGNGESYSASRGDTRLEDAQ